MLLKQNCFVISDAEYSHLESGTYCMPKTGYTGSSLQRKRNKDTDFNFKENKKEKLLLKSDTSTIFADQWAVALKEKRELAELINKNKLEEIEKGNIPAPFVHTLSPRSKSKLRNKVIAWSKLIPEKQSVKFTFVTLTLTSPQIGTDKEFTKMQNTFFTYLRKYYPTLFKRYLYVLERQKNGNIHSHIICSNFLPIQAINRAWCRVLSDHGYTYEQNGQKVSPMDALSNVSNWHKRNNSLPVNQRLEKKQCPFSTPSPVDIRQVHDLKAVSSYVTKYITKNESNMHTQVWNCSGFVSKLWTGAYICAQTHFLALKRMVVTEKKIMLDNADSLTVYLLSNYTNTQKNIFSQVNKYET
ncbi:hypothetical protein [Pedobacter sp. JCM 36344]|uniref:rolling circle replication-associated protein n=1 Tax=Pedobacter sp. JCM 36344 TaxID=3374280 RepID=UPI0039796704